MFLKKNILLILLFCLGKIFAQPPSYAYWQPVVIQPYAIQQLFPDTITLTEKQIYSDKGVVTLKEYSSTDKINHQFYAVYARTFSTKKEAKSVLKDEIKRYAIQYGMYPSEVTQKDSTEQSFTQIELLTNKQKIVVQFRELNKVLYVQRVEQNLADFSNKDAQYFFKGFSTSSVEKPIAQPSITTPVFVNENVKTETQNFIIYFPVSPEYIRHYIKNDSGKDYTVESYVTNDNKSGLGYQLIIRTYDKQMTQPETWLKNAVSAFTTEHKISTVSENALQTANTTFSKEYIFQTKKQAYKIRYLLSGNTLYQLCISGKMKTINKKNNTAFFEQFSLKNKQ